FASPVSFLLQRRVMRDILEWLDADAPDAQATQRAFAAMLSLPLRTAHLATLNWLVPVALVSVGMELLYGELWSLWDVSVLLVGGIAAGFSLSTLMGLFRNGGEFARVRDALARAVGDPEERRRLSPQMSIRVKLPSMVMGACVVPLLFAVLVAVDQGKSSLDAFAHSWTERVLSGLPADAAES